MARRIRFQFLGCQFETATIGGIFLRCGHDRHTEYTQAKASRIRRAPLLGRHEGVVGFNRQDAARRGEQIRGNLESAYADVFTAEAIAALEALAGLDAERKAVMAARIQRRAARARNKQRIAFLDPQATIARTNIKVQDARAGAFESIVAMPSTTTRGCARANPASVGASWMQPPHQEAQRFTTTGRPA